MLPFKEGKMRLEQMYINFGESPPEQQAAFMAEYRLRRASDLAKIPSTKKSTSKKPALELSEEDKALMKKLGLKQKDIIAMREAVSDTEEDKNSAELFKEDSFEEGDEEE
jgi:hypothetical protein